MTRLRKQRRKKKFRYSINRKRLRNKITSVGSIGCEEISNEWEISKSVNTNLKEMGLSHDPNTTVSIPKRKTTEQQRLTVPDETFRWIEEEIETVDVIPESKTQVMQKLLEDAKAPRRKMLRLPGSVIEWVSYLLDTYGKNYKAMAKDKTNYNQETWKQIRQKIRLFKSIPEQYNKYLEARGLQPESDSKSDLSDNEL